MVETDVTQMRQARLPPVEWPNPFGKRLKMCRLVFSNVQYFKALIMPQDNNLLEYLPTQVRHFIIKAAKTLCKRLKSPNIMILTLIEMLIKHIKKVVGGCVAKIQKSDGKMFSHRIGWRHG